MKNSGLFGITSPSTSQQKKTVKVYESSSKLKEKDCQSKPKMRDSKRDKTKMQKIHSIQPLPLEEHFSNQVSLSSNHFMSTECRKSH